MATLKYVREVKNSRLLSLGIVEGEESARYTVTESIYLEIGRPGLGDELTDEDMSAIKYADELVMAEKKALSLLSYADNNRRTLKQKLLRAGFGYEISDTVCEKMCSLGYIDENRQLERLVLIEANTKLRGPERIIPALVAKGYSLADVKAVMRELVDSGVIDFRKNAKTLINKKLPDADIEEKRKFLYKNGYKI